VSYPDRLQQVVDAFAALDMPERMDMLLGYGDRFREVPPEIASRPYAAERRVPGCESEAYVWAVPQDDGTITLYFAVENPSGVSAKALAAILDKTLSGLAPEAIAELSPDLVYDLFRENISMAKGIGLMGMVHAVRTLAREASRGRHRAATTAAADAGGRALNS
jgi:cysteine desulfuration protein SufE